MDTIPHFAWPIRFVGLRYATAEQNSDDEVMSCVAVICSFERGSRPEAPGFGITDPTLQISPPDSNDIYAAVGEYEPRAEIDITTTYSDVPSHDQMHVAVRQATGAED